MEANNASTPASSSDTSNSEGLFSIWNKMDDSSKAEQNRKKSDMRKVVCGLTKAVSNYYGENCEDSLIYFNVMTEEMTKEDFLQTPFLLPLKDVLEECNFLYEIRPNKIVKESFFFLQDTYMQRFSKFYPDYMCVDLLCELTKLKLNVYVFIGIDTNGTCEIIALGFVKSCDVGIKWLCDTFIKHNQKAEKNIKVILSNKILQGNKVFRNAFLDKPVLTSFFHFMQYLKKKLSNIGFNDNDENKKNVLMIVEKMCSASGKAEWATLLEELKHSNKAFLNDYKIFDEIKEQWIFSKKFDFKLLWRSFNIFLYSIRKSLKPNICSLDTIEEVLKFCCSFIENSRREKFKNLVSSFQKPIVSKAQMIHFNYSQILTPFATKLIFEQLDASNSVTTPSPDDIVDQHFNTCESFCTCNFFELVSLPCNHLLAKRRRRDLELFAESMCSKKWFIEKYKKMLIELFNVFFEQIVVASFEECKNYFGISAEVRPLECSDDISEQRSIILPHLMRIWDKELDMSDLGALGSGLSADSIHLYRVLKSYRSRGIYTNKTFQESYGISLDDILNCDEDTF